VWLWETWRPGISLKKRKYCQPKAGTPGNRVQPACPIVMRWFELEGLTSPMYRVAHALYAVIPPTLAQYASLFTSASFQTSHIAILGLSLYRAMIARTRS